MIGVPRWFLAYLAVSSYAAHISTDDAGEVRGTNDRFDVSQVSLKDLSLNWFSQSEITFLLYNQNDINNPIETYVDGSDTFFATFDTTKSTVIVIGGWVPYGQSTAVIVLKEAYLEQYDCNVIHVDWSAADNYIYLISVAQMQNVGLRTAVFIDRLVGTFNVSLEDIHIIGHSLGAHVGGIAGYNVKSGKIGRVTGLDAARPFVNFDNHNKSLSTESAQLVVAVHTSFLGVRKAIGHVDFYANRGTSPQPGCVIKDLLLCLCSHYRAYDIYAEALARPEGFDGELCSSWSDFKKGRCTGNDTLYMNDNITSSARGTYYFYTESSSPFAEGTVSSE